MVRKSPQRARPVRAAVLAVENAKADLLAKLQQDKEDKDKLAADKAVKRASDIILKAQQAKKVEATRRAAQRKAAKARVIF